LPIACFSVGIRAHGSFGSCDSRRGIVSTVKPDGVSAGVASLHSSGVATDAPGRARVE
jgi:hypothetical protein